MVRAAHEALRVGAAVREVVPRRQAQRRLQLRRPPRRGRPRRQGRVPLGGRARRRPARDHLRRPARARSTRTANALKALGVGKGTAVGIYLGMVPEAPIAMLACARLGAPHTVVFGGFSADSLSDRLHDMGCEVLITQDEAWRRGTTVPLKRTADEALAALADREEGARPPPHRQRGADDGGPRRLVARGRDRRHAVPARADGRRGSALPALHLGHDREAEGDRAHDRRLPRRRRDDAPLRLRPEARDRRLLVRRRRRLGHRATATSSTARSATAPRR